MTVFKLLISIISCAQFLVKYLKTLHVSELDYHHLNLNSQFAGRVAAYLRLRKL